jgi:iron complex outermembrane receptor protein
MPKPGKCPDPGLIAAHAEGRLVGEEATWMDEHLLSCPTCLEVFTETLRFTLDTGEMEPAPGLAGPRRPSVREFVLRPAVRVAASIGAAAAALLLAFLLGRDGPTTREGEARVADVREEKTQGPSAPAEATSGMGESRAPTAPRPRTAMVTAEEPAGSPRRLSPPPRPEGAPGPAPTTPHREEPARPPREAGSAPAEQMPTERRTVPAPAREKEIGATGAQPEANEMVRLGEEITVVSASRVEQPVVDAPATMSVITSETLETTPARDYADILRSLPGLNAIQTSGRDVNVAIRQATSTLAGSTLVAVDGRSVYQDFFNFVLWDFVPSPSSGDIRQIEVVRGPASVVWGANAANGVVNFVTKRPRVNEGFALVLGAGLFGRDGGSREADGSGRLFDGGLSFADAPNDTWSYKLSAGYYYAEPYSRPVGEIPLDCHPLGESPCRDANGNTIAGGYPIGGARYPVDANVPGGFENQGTSQPRLYLRVDQDLWSGGRITYEGGFGGTRGIVHTGIGPFDLQSGSYMGFGRVLYRKGALRLNAYANLLDGEAPSLLQADPDSLGPITLGFKTQTYDLSFNNTMVLGGRHALTYGADYRRNNFDVTIARGPDRNEFGAYAQDEFFLERFRLAAGIRADKFASLDDWVWSPRVSVMYKPAPDHSIRASYSRAFVSPSFINDHLDQRVLSPTPIDLSPLTAVLPPPLGSLVPPPFFLTVKAVGNPDLREQSTESWEIAYVGTFGRTTVGLAGYLSDTDDNIRFVSLLPPGRYGFPQPTFYDVDNPARGVTLPTPTTPATAITLSPVLMGVLGQVPPELGGPVLFPETTSTYLNLGSVRNYGIETSLDHHFNNEVSAFANYSWQETPQILDTERIPFPPNELGIPPRHRFNAGLAFDGPLVFANANLNHTSRALWVDVLTSEFAGFTDGYTMLNATVGVRLLGGRLVLSLKGTNLANQRIQQHVFGDVTRRSIVGEVRILMK